MQINSDFDKTWKHPQHAQQKALEYAIELLPKLPLRYKLTHYQVAEMICIAPDTYWYAMIKGWASGRFDFQSDNESYKIWKAGAQFALDVIDSGYSVQHNRWWSIKEVTTDKQEAITMIVYLTDLAYVLLEVNRSGAQNIGAAVWILFDILLGQNWRLRYEQLLHARKMLSVK